MFDDIRRAVGGGIRKETRKRVVRASYDAARTTDDNRRHWANADHLSAAAANDPATRRTLRNRARYEVANNSYARGIVSTLANDIIGTGPRLQVIDDPEAREIEEAFGKWSKAVGLAAKLRTMQKSRTTDGEGFGVLVRNPKVPHQVQLDVLLVEADQIATPDLSPWSPTEVDGIKLDEYGNPVEYHMLKAHPGDALWGGRTDYDVIDPRFMIHWFRQDRPGQVRGVPDLLPALPLFAQLRRYTLACIAAAEIAADIAGVMKTNGPADDEDDAPRGTPFEAVEIEKGMLLTMPDGYDVTQFRAEQPTTTYPMFKGEILNEIARCIDMPYNVAACNSSGYNYASGRLDHQTYYQSVRVEQSGVELVILSRIFLAWLVEYDMARGLKRRKNAPAVQWFWDGREHVDPAKEATAQATRLESHTTTLAQEYARKGQDWEEQLTQRSKELALMRKLGLPLGNGQNAAQQAEEPKE